MWLLAQARDEPYYPGFRDLNLFFVAIVLVTFLYGIAVATVAYRIASLKGRLREIGRLLEQGIDEDSKRSLLEDRDRFERDLALLTSSGPGRWFR